MCVGEVRGGGGRGGSYIWLSSFLQAKQIRLKRRIQTTRERKANF